jgi:hypothetical protein
MIQIRHGFQKVIMLFFQKSVMTKIRQIYIIGLIMIISNCLFRKKKRFAIELILLMRNQEKKMNLYV